MKAVYRALALGALAAALVARSGHGSASCTAPEKPGANPTQRAKSNSFAPHGPSHRHVYGAPIQRPIVSSRTRHKRRPAAATLPHASTP